jgi:hypothetical protein
MIRNPVRSVPVIAMVALVVVFDPAGAQEPREDPRWVAAQWMLEQLEEQFVADPGSTVVVDTLSRPHLHGMQAVRPLHAEELGSNRAIARRLGSRTGTLRDLVTCPKGSPDPQAFAEGRRRGCRLTDGVRVVLQLDAAEPRETGVMVRVASWTFREGSRGGYSVDLYSQELTLEESATGIWEVVGLGLAIRGHW